LKRGGQEEDGGSIKREVPVAQFKSIVQSVDYILIRKPIRIMVKRGQRKEETAKKNSQKRLMEPK